MTGEDEVGQLAQVPPCQCLRHTGGAYLIHKSLKASTTILYLMHGDSATGGSQ